MTTATDIYAYIGLATMIYHWFYLLVSDGLNVLIMGPVSVLIELGASLIAFAAWPFYWLYGFANLMVSLA